MSYSIGLAELFADLQRGLAGHRWCVIGAQAAILYGSTRMTLDVDISVDSSDAGRVALLQSLLDAGFVARRDDALEFAAKTGVLLLLHRATDVPVDVIFAGPGLEQDFIDRARRFEMEAVSFAVISPEDLIAAKMLAGRPRDIEDVAAVLRRAPALEIASIRELLVIFEQALDRSDLLPEFERLLRARGKPV